MPLIFKCVLHPPNLFLAPAIFATSCILLVDLKLLDGHWLRRLDIVQFMNPMFAIEDRIGPLWATLAKWYVCDLL